MKKLLVIGLVFVIALTVVLAVVVAGCGSDTTETTIATETTLGATDTTAAAVDTTVAPVVEDTTTTVAE